MEQNTLDTIAKIVNWYSGLSADCRDIERLTSAQRKLSCLLFEYAGEVGDLYKASKASEYMRKSAFEKERLRLIGDGESAAKAEIAAKAAVDKLLFAEVCADADYRAAQMQHQAAGDVLRSMLQNIASMKEERRLEMQGQGSQTT